MAGPLEVITGTSYALWYAPASSFAIPVGPLSGGGGLPANALLEEDGLTAIFEEDGSTVMTDE